MIPLGRVCCVVVVAAGIYGSLDADSGSTISLARPLPSDACNQENAWHVTSCAAPPPVIHIDDEPAFACLTPQGTLGDRLVGDACATGANGRTTGAPGAGSVEAATGAASP